jgi:hypothetical protein
MTFMSKQKIAKTRSVSNCSSEMSVRLGVLESSTFQLFGFDCSLVLLSAAQAFNQPIQFVQ